MVTAGGRIDVVVGLETSGGLTTKFGFAATGGATIEGTVTGVAGGGREIVAVPELPLLSDVSKEESLSSPYSL